MFGNVCIFEESFLKERERFIIRFVIPWNKQFMTKESKLFIESM